MGIPPTSRDTNRAAPDQGPGLPRVHVVWPDEAPTLEQEAELIDRLFGDAIAQLFKDTS
ncbi:MAG: hypothetical protein V4537_06105 [Pseudomonadota bacterium]